MDTYKLVFIAAVMLAFLYAVMQQQRKGGPVPQVEEMPVVERNDIPTQEELAQYALECLGGNQKREHTMDDA